MMSFPAPLRVRHFTVAIATFIERHKALRTST